MSLSNQPYIVEAFADLFGGRTDAYGAGGKGGARLKATGEWPQVAELHLRGVTPVGVYPVKQDADDRYVCKWGCVDFDIITPDKPDGDYEDVFAAAAASERLLRVLRQLDVRGFLEESRSGGYHVWVFADGWAPARDMRRTLLAACKLANVSAREVNPKQEELTEKKPYGNYVRLPYPGAFARDDWRTTSQRQMFLISGLQAPLDAAVQIASENRVSRVALESAAKLWVPPETKEVKVEVKPLKNDQHQTVVGRLNGLAYTIYREGPLGARYKALLKLAVECRKSGLSENECYWIVKDADERWGKFAGRPDCEDRLLDTVRKAYG